MNPLIGPNEPRYGGERFIPTSQSYDKEYGQMFKSAANELGLSDAIKEGVYVFLSGPCFETIAEVRMLKTMGKCKNSSLKQHETENMSLKGKYNNVEILDVGIFQELQ